MWIKSEQSIQTFPIDFIHSNQICGQKTIVVIMKYQ